MATFPSDVVRQVCLYLNHKEIKEVAPHLYNDENDTLWTMLLGRIKDVELEERPEGMSRRAFYGHLLYEKPMKTTSWTKDSAKSAMEDEIFLQRHINTRDEYRQTILMTLIDDIEPGDIAYLVHLGLDIDAQRKDGNTALFLSSLHDKSCENTQALIDLGANVNIRGYLGRTALVYATWNSSKNILPLIKAGIDVNKVYTSNTTALMHAVAHGNIEAVKILIENGADPTIIDDSGWGALEWCTNLEIRKIIEKAMNK